VDKSKPPVGGLVLERLLDSRPQDAWVGDLLLPQFVMWSRWWAQVRRAPALCARRVAAR